MNYELILLFVNIVIVICGFVWYVSRKDKTEVTPINHFMRGEVAGQAGGEADVNPHDTRRYVVQTVTGGQPALLYEGADGAEAVAQFLQLKRSKKNCYAEFLDDGIVRDTYDGGV